MKNNLDCLMNIILIILILILSVTNNKEVKKIATKITSGSVNTILIIVIITLVLTENIKIGFYLTILYLFLLIKYNNIENFKSENGYSPLNCKTYGDSRKKTGSSFYPLHAMN